MGNLWFLAWSPGCFVNTFRYRQSSSPTLTAGLSNAFWKHSSASEVASNTPSQAPAGMGGL